jgi:hypothetical protein
MLPPCACLVRIMSPTVLPRRYARRPRRTLRSHDRQRTSRKLSVHAAALCSPCANYLPHHTAQAAAYATIARLSTRIKQGGHSKAFQTRPRAKGSRRVRYARAIVYATHARAIVNAHHASQACMLSPCARLVRIISPTGLPRRYARRPRRTLRSHDSQRTSRKLSAPAAALCLPCARYLPHYTAQAAAYATLVRSPTRIT